MKDDILNALGLIDVPEELEAAVNSGIERAASERRGITMKRSVKRIAAVCAAAAAAVCLLGVSVTAAVFAGNIGKEKAYSYAASYAVIHAEDGEKEELAGLVVGGNVDVGGIDESEISLGLSGMRPIYNVGFTAGRYSYSMKVDGKTGVVLEYTRSDSGKSADVAELPENLEVTVNDAFDITSDWFGLFNVTACEDSMYKSSSEYDENGYTVVAEHGGYTYSCKIDRKTGSVSEATVTEIKGAKDRHLHTADSSYYGLYNAKKLIYRDIGSVPELGSGASVTVVFSANTPEKPNGYGRDVYLGRAGLVNSTVSNAYVIDAHTGEIISGSVYDSDPTKPANEAVSTDAPEGMISEADAKAIALGDAGAEESRISGFTIDLDGGAYSVGFECGNESGVFSYRYSIDAMTGEILDAQSSQIG